MNKTKEEQQVYHERQRYKAEVLEVVRRWPLKAVEDFRGDLDQVIWEVKKRGRFALS